MQRRRKIAVLGTRSVGKSSLVKQFVENSFSESYYPTIERAYLKTIVHNGVEYACEIFDTAGQDEFSPINMQHTIGIHGYVFVYSITSPASLQVIQIVYDKLCDLAGVTNIPCVIVGTKSDLASSRRVNWVEGKAVADAVNGGFIEVSSKNGNNVARAFELCIDEIEKRLKMTHGVAQDHKCTVM
ncbi:P-loop containing nucleoside triphosphate hydrolase protein [Cylindrobasidium torrendii FP15055 ss-10]|uniref:p-loop containing nucleoside triphosphate hydrolase protein n=1 Tax=Cylindrobasidium torrendii FP15055 ss-10 TaxID=1314674 RepID=A0A0D7BJJ8_9AGAR|nr:P-loop containing nucleoside triphosphate hydrolase protein [Cylindrobasidium torrendii FP15055 ss-10]